LKLEEYTSLLAAAVSESPLSTESGSSVDPDRSLDDTFESALTELRDEVTRVAGAFDEASDFLTTLEDGLSTSLEGGNFSTLIEAAESARTNELLESGINTPLERIRLEDGVSEAVASIRSSLEKIGIELNSGRRILEAFSEFEAREGRQA
jgi:hypothetical protein